MKAVIPLGRNRPPTLPYVCRALEANTPVTEIVTVGETPSIKPDLHIASPNDKRHGHLNVLQHLATALDQITDAEFVWIADDVFPLKPWTPGVYVRKASIAAHLRMYASRGAYSRAIRASVEIIRDLGHDPEQVPCGSIHRPWLVNADRVRDSVKLVQEKGDGEWKTVYVAGLNDTIPAGDPKLVGRGMPKPNADMISVFVDSWRYNAGRIIRETFPDPSRWEQ